MGSRQSNTTPQVDPDAAASNNVEMQLIEQQLQELFKFKILLLGAGESGKSTVVKQLKLIHKKKISAKELKMTGTSLHQNVVDCMKALLHASKQFNYYDLDAEDIATEEILLNHDESERLAPEMADRIARLFNSPTITKTYERRSEFWLLDSFPYYIKNLPRFCEPEFVPTEEDSVMARIRTTGIVVSELEQKITAEHKDEPDMIKYQVVDVGGQRNERKKWMHCFSDVKAILFIVNCAGYNQVLFEDSSKNRMIEELELFQSVTHNPMFENTPIFLFLNKKDLFETMVTEVDMKCTFADYTGGKNLKPALEYIENQFKKQLPPNKQVQIHTVTARWKRDIRSAFEEVKKTLYDDARPTLLAAAKKIKTQRKVVDTAIRRAEGESSGCSCGR